MQTPAAVRKPLRIALLIDSLSGGGAERVFLILARLWLAMGCEVHMIVLAQQRDYEPPPGLRLHLLGPWGLPRRWLSKRYAAWRLRRLVRALERDAPFDLRLSTLLLSDEIARLAGLRVWHRIANTMSAKLRLPRLWRREPAEARRRLEGARRRYRGTDMIAISQGVADDLRDPMQLQPARLVVIPNPLDVEQLREAAREPAPLPAQPYIVHASRFHAQKRHDLLLDAFAQLEFEGMLVLLTKPAEKLRRMIRERGLESRVLLPGFQRNPYPWIARARLLVLCSDWEGLGNVLLEALALGVPAVSTDCRSGPAEILTGELAAFLSPVGDAPALAATMARALKGYPPIRPGHLAAYAPRRIAERYLQLAEQA